MILAAVNIAIYITETNVYNLESIIGELKNNELTLYSYEETNEILFSIYTSIIIALRLQSAATLLITPLQVIYLKKDGEVILKFPEDVVEIDRLNNLYVFDFILSKDKLVSSLLQIISSNDKEIRCKINRP